MAYANLVNQLVADKAEMFCRIRDFICKRNGTYDYSTTGIGWTLWDSSYAVDEDNPQSGDWFVMFSAGESGDEDLYIFISWTSSYFVFRMYHAWDPSTHAGSAHYSGGNLYYVLETVTSTYLSIYGNLDFLFPFYIYGTNDNRGCALGALEPAVEGVDRETVTCSSTLTAGNDVSITVDSVPSNWEVGRKVFIRTTHTNNVATVYYEHITIKTLVGNTITADLTYNYTANSKLCFFMCYVVPTSYVMFGAVNVLFTSSESTASVSPVFINGAATFNDPTGLEDRYGLFEPIMQEGSGWPVAKYQFIKSLLNAGSLTPSDTIEDLSGDVYRYNIFYSLKFIAVLEV